MKVIKKIAIALGLILVGVVAVVVFRIGPRNILGMMRYDQRKEGSLRVGDAAPDAALVAPDGARRVRIQDSVGGKPLVLVFGSFT